MEFSVQHEHDMRLMDLLDKTNINQQDIIAKMTEQYKQHHNLLRGYNKITNSMAGERKVSQEQCSNQRYFSYESKKFKKKKIF